jgi:hypothetical protein
VHPARGREDLDRARDVERLGAVDGEDGDAHDAILAGARRGGKDANPTISANDERHAERGLPKIS